MQKYKIKKVTQFDWDVVDAISGELIECGFDSPGSAWDFIRDLLWADREISKVDPDGFSY